MQGLSCGTSRIVGCRFSVYPMADNFVEIIKGALEEVSTEKVWMKTDDVSTCIRGRSEHVFDVAKAIFTHAAKTGVHVVFNGTFSIGCPGDSDGDTYMSEDDVRLNEEAVRNERVEVATQFSLYPLNNPDYMQIIADQVAVADKHGTFTKGVHYASRLDGDVNDVFRTLEEAFYNAAQTHERSHVTMTAAVSANSPSTKDK
ncbi:YkoF family thiamine/hydroxymethylpyrimidine-binding protein [Alteribacter natronophilus]|uniref:YkoF family thiamine/hydroxymethylpyrimidine-binding protein n=1 Tax=Alteribacter natronophilus TaxID=2583810 RepID=UPI00110D437A|nr:YkoF family thiamine/hydroxymethylpyrimidine-binding protein [Alteribacter natronophilus]TMW70291.1 thiamine-binding protein [Alteribacter natronophilus]